MSDSSFSTHDFMAPPRTTGWRQLLQLYYGLCCTDLDILTNKVYHKRFITSKVMATFLMVLILPIGGVVFACLYRLAPSLRPGSVFYVKGPILGHPKGRPLHEIRPKKKTY